MGIEKIATALLKRFHIEIIEYGSHDHSNMCTCLYLILPSVLQITIYILKYT